MKLLNNYNIFSKEQQVKLKQKKNLEINLFLSNYFSKFDSAQELILLLIKITFIIK